MKRLFLALFISYAGLSAQQADPFADLPAAPAPPKHETSGRSWTENLGFRKEIMSQFDTTEDGRPASRQSVGFEILKKFSTRTAT